MTSAPRSPYNGGMRHLSYKTAFLNPQEQLDFHFYYKPNVKPHSHDYYEFQFVVKGRCYYRTEGITHTVGRGDMLFTKPDEVHELHRFDDKDFQLITISVTPDCLAGLCLAFSSQFFDEIRKGRCFVMPFRDFEYDYLTNLFLHLPIPEQDPHQLSLRIKTWIIAALSAMQSSLSAPFSDYPRWFGDILQEMNSPLQIGKRLFELPHMTEHSPTTVGKFFKRYFGITPNAYFQARKIDYACHLLRTTNKTTLDIAAQVGFDSLSHFNRIFKEQKGATPRDYRNG